MKPVVEISEKKVLAVGIDPALDQYDRVVLFPAKLARANARLKKIGFLGLKSAKSRTQA